MSPTLYTAKNNGGDDNGVSITMVIATTMANNRIRFGAIRSTFLSSCYGAVSEPYKSSRQRRARSRLFYRRCGGTYGVLHGWNVSGVVGQRYSIYEEGRNEHPLTEAVVEAWTLAELASFVGQSRTLCLGLPQNKHKLLSIHCCRSC